MNKTFIKKVRDLLLAQKKEILAQSSNHVVEVDTDGDETDEIQANILIGLNNQLNSRNLEKLARIDTALKRIEDSNYGLCQDCEEPINEKRLLSNPHFQTCIACAEEREAEEKQRKRF